MKGKSRFHLSPVWRSKPIGRKTEPHIFNTNVRSVLLYGFETWRTTKATSKKIRTFVNERILQIYWPDNIPNERPMAYNGARENGIADHAREDAGVGWVTPCANHIPPPPPSRP